MPNAGIFAGSIVKQDKGKGLLEHPLPNHSGRQCRPHKGF